jgi:hypothetical protein
MRVDITSIGATKILVGMTARMARLADLYPEMEQASELFYDETRAWYDSRGDGTWAPLAASTIAAKISQGRSDPGRPLYAEGNLRESATSASGPYSYRIIDHRSVIMGVDWDVGGWQIPMILSYGDSRIPARPIWPEGIHIERLQTEIGKLILKGI